MSGLEKSTEKFDLEKLRIFTERDKEYFDNLFKNVKVFKVNPEFLARVNQTELMVGLWHPFYARYIPYKN